MDVMKLHNKRLVTYILFAYGITWIIWLPNLLARNVSVGWGFSGWLQLAGGLGPFLSGLITTCLFEKREGVKTYFRDKLFRRPESKWILLGVGMPVVFFLIAVFGGVIVTGSRPVLSDLGVNAKLPVTNPLLIWLSWCFFYGLGEEGGWRGFLFPELSKRFPARIATLYTAFIWAPWHLPLFFYDKDFSAMRPFGIIGWLVGLVFGSLLLGWLVKQARYVLWPVVLWHGTFNFFTAGDRINPMVPGFMSALVIITVFWIARKYGENLEKTPG